MHTNRFIFFLFAAVIIIPSSSIHTQPRYSIILDAPYSSLPFSTRIEHSGVYGISSFDIAKNNLIISSFNSNSLFTAAQGRLSSSSLFSKLPSSSEGTISSETHGLISSQKKGCYSYFGKTTVLYASNNGSNSDNAGNELSVSLTGRTSVHLSYRLGAFKGEFSIPFNNNLGYAEFLGTDSQGNFFILAETYCREIPLEVDRFIITASADGTVLARLKLPQKQFLSLVTEFRVDSCGTLFHLISDSSRFYIFEWKGLTVPSLDTVQYPSRYSFGNLNAPLNPTNEISPPFPETPQAVVRRSDVLHYADTYAVHIYGCSSSNLAPADTPAPDGDIVRTPPWIAAGANGRIPYKWGGFNTLTEFDAGIKNGKFAGDINTNGVSGYAVGVDCSGFVSRCWQLTYHSATSMMPSITTQYISWDSLKAGDAVHKVGHVRLFINRTANGGFRVIEAAARAWDVSYWTFTLSDLATYTPRYYSNIAPDASNYVPLLLSAFTVNDSTVLLQWNCDSTLVAGYRVYESANGTAWTQIASEQTAKNKFLAVRLIKSARHYRVSSVLSGSLTESNWSNPLSVSNNVGTKKTLLVDGFERQDGSWQGPSHPFIPRYASILTSLHEPYESAMNAAVIKDSLPAQKYHSIFWLLGDESVGSESFSAAEQIFIQRFLEAGGNLFVSGGEIGYDLGRTELSADKAFYNNYLKAKFISDNAAAAAVAGVSSAPFSNLRWNIGQTYPEDYPDEIDTLAGSRICVRYSNGKGGGVFYSGKFGNSQNKGQLIYLSFPLESTANDTAFKAVIENSIKFFNGSINGKLVSEIIPPSVYGLHNAFPNPFNPSTRFRFTLPEKSEGSVVIYDAIGQSVTTIFKGTIEPNKAYECDFNAAGLSSGMYFAVLKAGNFITARKAAFVK